MKKFVTIGCQQLQQRKSNLRLTLLSTKTRAGGFSPVRSSSRKASILPASLPTNTNSWSIVSVAAFRCPIEIVYSPFKFFFAHLDTGIVHVALNKPTFSASPVHALKIVSNCLRKLFLPSSNSLSASSNINHSVLMRIKGPIQ